MYTLKASPFITGLENFKHIKGWKKLMPKSKFSTRDKAKPRN
jgi:hypothetical protein